MTSIIEDRRLTFAAACGQGDVLSDFLARHKANNMDADEGADDSNNDSSNDDNQQMIDTLTTLIPEAHTAAAVVTPPSTNETGRRTTRRTPPPAAIPSASTSGASTPRGGASSISKPPMHPSSARVLKSSVANKENSKLASTSVSASSPLAKSTLKRKSVGLNAAVTSNNIPLPLSASIAKPPMHPVIAKKPRVSMIPTSLKQNSSVGPLSGTMGAPSPRKVLGGGGAEASSVVNKRRSMVTTSSASMSSLHSNNTATAAAAAAGASSAAAAAAAATLHADQSLAIRQWRSTASWRLVLLRLQKQALATSSAQLVELQNVQASIQSQLLEARSTIESTAQQLELTSQSESMLKLAAEEMSSQIDVLTREVSSARQELADQTQELNDILASERQATAEKIERMDESETRVREQLAMVEAQLAQVQEARFADELQRKALHNSMQDLKGSIRVFCRIRPSASTPISALSPSSSAAAAAAAAEAESVDPSSIPSFVKSIGTTDFHTGGSSSSQGPVTSLSNFTEVLNVSAPAGTKVDGGSAKQAQSAFTFDKVFPADSTQQQLFAELDQLVTSAMDSSSNVSVFAYGATGSGKTHTMLGEEGEGQGMIPRAITRLFAYAQNAKARQWNYNFKLSCMEIYNEELRDLLATTNKSPSSAAAAAAASSSSSKDLKIQHDKSGRIHVVGLEVFAVNSASEVHTLLAQGARQRALGATACNARSSRSHTIFQLHIEGSNARNGEKVVSMINLIDLAGSERISSSQVGSNPVMLKETQHINSSLSTLVTCMSCIASRSSHVPVRDSKLTYLLQDSIGAGKSGAVARTLFFVNIAPEAATFGETMCTLRFAEKLKNVEMNASAASSSSSSSSAAAANASTSGAESARRVTRRQK